MTTDELTLDSVRRELERRGYTVIGRGRGVLLCRGFELMVTDRPWPALMFSRTGRFWSRCSRVDQFIYYVERYWR